MLRVVLALLVACALEHDDDRDRGRAWQVRWVVLRL